MKTLVRVKTQCPVTTGEVVKDNRGRRYFVSHIHNNKVGVVSMDGKRLSMVADPRLFNCYLTNR